MTGNIQKGTIACYPMVTAIITAYNQGKYLPDALESLFSQTYPNLEIIVVDDGSTDDTCRLMENYSSVKYIRQENKGLSSARNTGIANSNGDYLVFLDADDMLYPDAVTTNINYFKNHPRCGFISGWHDRMNENKELLVNYNTPPPQKDFFLTLLKNNYIGMHATVMYHRRVFNQFLYDESLLACEDHDIYLKVAKHYPVFSHSEKIAAYRFHDHNMSYNISLMLPQALKVLKLNRDDLFDPEAKFAYLTGKRYYKSYYTDMALKKLKSALVSFQWTASLSEIKLLLRVAPKQLIKACLHKSFQKTKEVVKARIPLKPSLSVGNGYPPSPKQGRVKLGDLRRTKPLSRCFGYDRGGPVDRVYIEGFLLENAEYIRGNVLEIGDNFYTRTYGGQRVDKSDVLFIDDSNPEATIIGDLSKADHISSNQFDCIILTQTLHLIYDFKSAIEHCFRLLKSGGTLLITVPGITPIDYGEWKDTWYWSFTGAALSRLLATSFEALNVRVQVFGNVLSATAFLYGMGREEINEKTFKLNDPDYPVIITGKAMKH